jgi:hypothetical protein
MAKVDAQGFKIEFTEWLMFHTSELEDTDIVSKFRRLVNRDMQWPIGKDFDAMLAYVKTAYEKVEGAEFAFRTAHNDFVEWEKR